MSTIRPAARVALWAPLVAGPTRATLGVMPVSATLALTLLTILALPAAGQSPDGSRAVVLLHHPYDCVDPFGVPYGSGADTGCERPGPRPGDTFSTRHYSASQGGRFDFPTFLADGVDPIVALPNPDVPFASTLSNYTARVESRLALGAPGSMRLSGSLSDDSLVVSVRFSPNAPLSDPQHPESLHLLLAVVEDFIHYEPDARISNGIADHRFTVRALRDTGPVDASLGEPTERNVTFPIPQDWARENLVVAAWVEASDAFGRFEAGEVLQAAWAHADGIPVEQRGKAVLVEVYSATWCAPCLFGDKAAEQLAVDYGGAPAAPQPAGPKYFRAPDGPLAVAVLALAAGAASFAVGRKRVVP